MREKRSRSFCGARLALKKLSRRLSGDDMQTPPDEINTIHQDGRPRCPNMNNGETLYCTASHDSRFAIAAVSEKRIGLDVEEISERVLKGQHHYMREEEQSLVKSHPLGEMAASVRIWSIKEAVTKATSLNLTEAWKKTVVREIGAEKSIIMIEDISTEAIHSIVDGHLFTIISID
jgi:phosphopantetheinyl transferase